MDIVKYQRPYTHQDYVDAMWLMFLRTPCRQAPDVDGSFSLGEIGEAMGDQKLLRDGPYSVCRGKRD